jgi:hypothetical protein
VRIVARVFLVVAFLLAQHAAVSHQIWHAAGAHPAVASASDVAYKHAPRSPNQLLCDFHSALGTVLGIVTAAAAACLVSEPPPSTPVAIAIAWASESAPQPHSRDPPRSLAQ